MEVKASRAKGCSVAEMMRSSSWSSIAEGLAYTSWSRLRMEVGSRMRSHQRVLMVRFKPCGNYHKELFGKKRCILCGMNETCNR